MDRPPKDRLSPDPHPGATIGTLRCVLTQRHCKLCGETFEIERKPGRPRIYCFTCEPLGWQVVKVRRRHKLRRRPSLYSVM
jgi:hypothetical protein